MHIAATACGCDLTAVIHPVSCITAPLFPSNTRCLHAAGDAGDAGTSDELPTL